MAGAIGNQMQECELRPAIAIAKAVNGVEFAEKLTCRVDEVCALGAASEDILIERAEKLRGGLSEISCEGLHTAI